MIKCYQPQMSQIAFNVREMNYSKDAVVGWNTGWTSSSKPCSFFEAPECKEADKIFPPVGNWKKIDQ